MHNAARSPNAFSSSGAIALRPFPHLRQATEHYFAHNHGTTWYYHVCINLGFNRGILSYPFQGSCGWFSVLSAQATSWDRLAEFLNYLDSVDSWRCAVVSKELCWLQSEQIVRLQRVWCIPHCLFCRMRCWKLKTSELVRKRIVKLQW